MTATSHQPSAAEADTAIPVLSIRDLHVEYYTDAGVVRAVNGVTFDLMPGQKLGLVGRVRLGQVHDRARADADDPATEDASPPGRSCSRVDDIVTAARARTCASSGRARSA